MLNTFKSTTNFFIYFSGILKLHIFTFPQIYSIKDYLSEKK